MIRRIAVKKDGTISMSEFRNFAEKYQGEIDKLEEENKKLENKILKLGTRIYQNIDGKKREEYQEYCKRHKL